MSANQEQQLQQLLDREAIRELPIKYCQYVWQARPDDWAALFTEDGVAVLRPPEEIRGRKQLREFIAPAMAESKPRPFIHNHVVELLGENEAKGWCCVEVRSGTNNLEWMIAGYYIDEYQKVKGEWKIKRREMREG